MQITITDIISAEMTRCLQSYKQLSAEGEKATTNDRYLCLQTALWMLQGGNPPAIRKTEEEVRYEIRNWIARINRATTVATMHADGRVVALLLEFLENTKPITPAPVQTTLI